MSNKILNSSRVKWPSLLKFSKKDNESKLLMSCNSFLDNSTDSTLRISALRLSDRLDFYSRLNSSWRGGACLVVFKNCWNFDTTLVSLGFIFSFDCIFYWNLATLSFKFFEMFFDFLSVIRITFYPFGVYFLMEWISPMSYWVTSFVILLGLAK